MRSKPHVCQLAQSNKGSFSSIFAWFLLISILVFGHMYLINCTQAYVGYDAVFFLYNATSKWFDIVRTGALRDLQLCFNLTRFEFLCI